MPGQFCNHAHVDRIGRIGAANQILHEIIAALHMGQHVGVERVKALGAHGAVVLPPNRIGHAGGFDHMLIFGRAASEFAGGHQECAALAQGAFAFFERGLDQRGLHKIVIDIAQPIDPLILKPELRVHPSKCHMPSSCSRNAAVLCNGAGHRPALIGRNTRWLPLNMTFP